MQTIFNQETREGLIHRIGSISPGDRAEWGKMNVHQMLAHNVVWNEWMLGKHNPKYKQAFIGFLFGKIGLRRMIKDDRPLDRNVPSSAFLIIKNPTTDIDSLKSIWSNLIQDYAAYTNPGFIHDFFGKMSDQQIGKLVYKHTDHHLRQFNR